MSANINIAGLTPVNDPDYRYTMPRIVAKVEGRGNGIKTLLVNVNDVAQALSREAPEVTKFFGCELGSQTTFSAETDRAIVNGAHTAQTLQTLLSKYIEVFVLCSNCRLPETHYKVKAGIISQRCSACGTKASVDMTHKLTTFILAQHKKAKESGGGKEKDKDKKKEGKRSAETPPAAAAGSEVVEKKDKDKKKDKKDRSGVDRVRSPGAGDEAGGGGGEGSEAGAEAGGGSGAGAASAGASEAADYDECIVGAEEAEEPENVIVETNIQRFVLWSNDNPTASTAAIVEELRVLQTLASLKVPSRVAIFLGAKFTEAIVAENQILQHKDVLAALGSTPTLQRHLISGFEWLCGSRFPSLTKFWPLVLKQLYDEELVEEEVIFEWATDLSRNDYSADSSMISLDVLDVLKAGAAPLLKWLQEAEEDEDDEEEGDEEEEEEEP